VKDEDLIVEKLNGSLGQTARNERQRKKDH
jgi:hypothetical protein